MYFTGRTIWRAVPLPKRLAFRHKTSLWRATALPSPTVGFRFDPSRHPRTGEIILQTGPRWDVKIADATDEIARRDAILRPLSLALPELRIRMHGDESTGMTPKGAPCGGWWHARCGYDWTDPVFF